MNIQVEPDYITQSKKLCKAAGMDPNAPPNPKRSMSKEDLNVKRKEFQEILSVVTIFSNKLLDFLKGNPVLIVVSDANGYLLEMYGDDSIQSTIRTLGIRIGSLFTQEDPGTNVISLALQQRHPVQVIGANHFHKALHGIACYGAAFCCRDENSLLGTINIMTPITHQDPMLLTMLSQIAETIERELQLRNQNKKLDIMNQIMLNRTRSGIIVTDIDGTIIEANELAQEVYPHHQGAIIGENIFDSDIFGNYFSQVLHHHKVYENKEFKFTNSHGQPFVCLLDAQPIFEDKKMIGSFGRFRDITDRYRMEEKMREAEKEALLGRIAAGIAHEVRNPLTTVRGFLQYLEKDVDDHMSELFSKLLIPEIDRANKIISDFLSISKPSFKEFESIRVESLLEYMWHFLKSEALLYNIDVQVEIEPRTKDVPILCNRDEMLQVFINLFQNSLQAKHSQPLQIMLATKLVNGEVHFVFSDNGNGIPAEVLEHIFEPFFSTKDEGTGLGLSVSRKIIENHNGTMEANSNPNGTSFVIVLPIHHQPEN
ncbi:ATP-binding protein [Mesobacillus maritimus]|uniref:ATP-binding protein n=1 Tax=Mesobacillus maritimus TaxID=1643336 RepID=UPI00203BD87A|nr:ATP-binding protein [Mesobacillus maritimus]MCM3585831.1 ATP-binding protein [Mesobacillus maritimus]